MKSRIHKHGKPPFKLTEEKLKLAGRTVAYYPVGEVMEVTRNITPLSKSGRFFRRKMYHELKKKGY